MVRPVLSFLLLYTVILGAAYPAAVTGFAQLVFPHQANGSLVFHAEIQSTDSVGAYGRTPSMSSRIRIGSYLIGQEFSDPKYFWGRLSATAAAPYDASASQGSNLGPLNPTLRKNVEDRIRALRKADPNNKSPIPIDLVTSSASGLDPDISPNAAFYQVERIARVRDMAPDKLRKLVELHVERVPFHLFGEPRVNVLRLNLALKTMEQTEFR